MKDDLGDRMKGYERLSPAEGNFMPLLPIVARIDGAHFHSFCKGMERPFDTKLTVIMRETTRWLVQETNACIGYTQSDEITLVFYSDSHKSQVFHDGRIGKMVSRLASKATVEFIRLLCHNGWVDKVDKFDGFDCRVWTVPTLMEAANAVLWRENDATKNSISMAARAHFSHKQLHGKNGGEMQEMLHGKGVNWNDYPPAFKRGTYFQRRKVVRAFTADEIGKLPKKHEVRTNPGLMVERTEVEQLDMPPFGKVVNRIGVIFHGEEPELVEAE